MSLAVAVIRLNDGSYRVYLEVFFQIFVVKAVPTGARLVLEEGIVGIFVHLYLFGRDELAVFVCGVEIIAGLIGIKIKLVARNCPLLTSVFGGKG